MANAELTQPQPTPGNELDIPKVKFAIQQLGISNEQAAELQGYIKRLIEEGGGDVKRLPIELLIIGRFAERGSSGPAYYSAIVTAQRCIEMEETARAKDHQAQIIEWNQ
ncbi:hypothetical protein N0V88_003275 [Collariella sp. IMI 366227]|nr:hypothetical protein N0V88_003275 [Collariella sp. IMI 366227]